MNDNSHNNKTIPVEDTKILLCSLLVMGFEAGRGQGIRPITKLQREAMEAAADKFRIDDQRRRIEKLEESWVDGKPSWLRKVFT